MQAEPTAPVRSRSPLVPVIAGFVLAMPFLPLFSMHPDGAFDTTTVSNRVLYAFTTDDRTYAFPLPGVTLHWFEAAFARKAVRHAAEGGDDR